MMNSVKKIMSILLLFTVVIGVISCSDDDSATVETNLIVLPTSLQYTAAGGYGVFNIATTSSTNWSISNTADWCTLSVTTGNGNKNINVEVTANTTTEGRVAVLTVTAGDISQDVQITQAAGTAVVNPGDEPFIPADPSLMSDFTSVQIGANLGLGWNLGNSLEAIGGETAWGNPTVNQALISSVKAAGFNAVRIPIAWSNFSDAENFVINQNWMNRVEEVVNYVLDNDMYAVINIHWDGGWMQPTYAQQAYVNNRLTIMWQQIAIRFRDYDHHLLFAGTNEVMVDGDYGAPTTEYAAVQNSFNQTFVNAVRNTGGRNAYRYLAVQGFNTNIDYTVANAIVPTDTATNRLLMEVHYYDPYNFALNENSTVWQWGANATDPLLTDGWGNEAHADTQFQKMKTNYVDQGIGVILGEYGAIKRSNVAGHEAYREDYVAYITQSALTHGLAPFYWDNGSTGNYSMGLFNRLTGEIVHQNIINAINGN